MISRRRFIASSSALLAAATLGARRRAGVLRIRTISDDARPDVERGIAFGLLEAKRSAALFGWDVLRAAGEDADALVTAQISASVSSLPTLLLVYDSAPSPTSFCLAPSGAAAPHDAACIVEAWHHRLERFGAEQLNARYRAWSARPMTADAWLGWFAIKVLAESALRTNSTDGAALVAHIARATFDGHKGAPLAFDAHRQLLQPLYEVCVDRRSGRQDIVREIPRP